MSLNAWFSIISKQNQVLPGDKFISTQSDFDALVISDNDVVSFERGKTFIGTKAINASNVTINAFGSGDNPIITGAEDISGLTWTDEGGIWSAPLASSPNWVNINGINAKLAETPYITITGRPANNQVEINPADVSGYTNIVGSKFVSNDRPFSFSLEFEVIAYSSGVITLDRDITNVGRFKLYNDEEYIINSNEWIWRNNTLKVKSIASPSTLNITKSTYNDGFTVNGSCSISGVDFVNQYKYGINIKASSVDIVGCNVHDIRGQGISCKTRFSNISIRNSEIYNIGGNGIWLGPQLGITVANNNIHDIGLGNNSGWNNDPNPNFPETSFTNNTAIKLNVDLDNNTLDADNVTISGNTINNTAYNGISFHIGQNGTIKRNIVSNTNLILKDGGGIYFFHYRDTLIPASGFTIEENFVSNVLNNPANGCIYMDNRCANNIVSYNVVTDYGTSGFGIMINSDTEQHDVNNNTVYATGVRGLWYRDNNPPGKLYGNDKNLINDNIICVRVNTYNTIEFSDGVNPYLNGGGGDNNYYINPYGTKILNDGTDKTLAQLQSTYSTDTNSTERTNYITAPGDPDNEILLIQNPADTVLNGSAPAGNWYDVDGNLVTNYTVQPWRSLLLLKNLI